MVHIFKIQESGARAQARNYMKKKVILINPPLSLEERYGALAEGGSSAPPVGLCNLASVILNDYDVMILDAAALMLTYEETLRRVEEYAPDHFCITAVTISSYNAAKLTAMYKERHPEKITILGGPHITAVPQETLRRFRQFDIGVIGEGEDTIVDLLDTLDNDKRLEDVKGLILRGDDGSIYKTQGRPFIKNLDKLPLPAWHLLPDLDEYYRPPIFSVQALPSTSIITSRGCSGKCTFCDRTVFGNTCRAFSADYVNEMLLTLMRDYGIKDLLFDDDNFTLFKPRLRKLCDIMIKNRYNLTWSCNARVDLVDYETLKMMRSAGCWQIAYGIESGSQKILDHLNKNISLETIRNTLKNTKKAGIQTKGFFMLGHPTETIETMRETIDLAKSLPLDRFQITQFTPLPGSEIYEEADKYGAFDKDWKKMNMWNTVFVPNDLTKDDLTKYSKVAFKEFYLRPKIIYSFIKGINYFRYLWEIFKGFKAFIIHLLSKPKESGK